MAIRLLLTAGVAFLGCYIKRELRRIEPIREELRRARRGASAD